MQTARDALAAYAERINRHDFDLLEDLIAPDASFWFTDGSVIEGETYWLDEHAWIAAGDTAAACTYRCHWTGTIEGRPASGSGRGTTVLKRVGDRWWITHEHLSRLPN